MTYCDEETSGHIQFGNNHSMKITILKEGYVKNDITHT